MRADDTNTVALGDRGRKSVRIHSNTSYDDAIFVLDVQHMPTGCGTWPAWWTLSQEGPWPAGGEIDIIEGSFEYSPSLSVDVSALNASRCPYEHQQSRVPPHNPKLYHA